MYKFKRYAIALTVATLAACKAPMPTQTFVPDAMPEAYQVSDTAQTAKVPWNHFYSDPNLIALIDSALSRNLELQDLLQEVEISRNDIRVRQGQLLPTVSLAAGADLEKVGRYTSQGAGDATTEIRPGHEMPEPLGNLSVAARAHWEVDIWKKLRNSKKAAAHRYLASIEGRNFVVTNVVAEIAELYYELLALDNQLAIVEKNIAIQRNALEVVKIQKENARATELGVQRYYAEVSGSEQKAYDIRQKIVETENRLNFLLGRYPQPILRSADGLMQVSIEVGAGVPAQLLENRPDIREAALQLEAAKMDVKVARAEFMPSLEIGGAAGLEAFNAKYLLATPESMLYRIGGELLAPLLNRNAIKAEYRNANARQLRALYHYAQTVLNAYIEVYNQISKVKNLQKRYALGVDQVAAVHRSVDIAGDLFKASRADYLEVLLTQRDALEFEMELVETKKELLSASVMLYRDIGGGWR